MPIKQIAMLEQTPQLKAKIIFGHEFIFYCFFFIQTLLMGLGLLYVIIIGKSSVPGASIILLLFAFSLIGVAFFILYAVILRHRQLHIYADRLEIRTFLGTNLRTVFRRDITGWHEHRVNMLRDRVAILTLLTKEKDVAIVSKFYRNFYDIREELIRGKVREQKKEGAIVKKRQYSERKQVKIQIIAYVAVCLCFIAMAVNGAMRIYAGENTVDLWTALAFCLFFIPLFAGRGWLKWKEFKKK